VRQLSTWQTTVSLDLGLDWRVLAFTAALACLSAVVAGVAAGLFLHTFIDSLSAAALAIPCGGFGPYDPPHAKHDRRISASALRYFQHSAPRLQAGN
jgi:hypothetical protein